MAFLACVFLVGDEAELWGSGTKILRDTMATVWKRSLAIRAARVVAYRNTVVRRCPRSFEMFPAFCGQYVIADPNQNS
jgi:hypothetical protein